ncbi:MAG TPA: GNAT family protein [Chitinophagaceae bacterium]|jgi:RimJ/RimL family protein N-acetyltransferase|nr:GNAT family protein [Chitinophagaceae bacterium]
MEFRLRPWKPEDLDSLVYHANNDAVARNMADQFPHPYTREKGEAFLQSAMQGTPPNILAIEVEGAAAGGIGVHLQGDIYCRNAELGYWLGEAFWGRGIMPVAVRQMVAYGFQHWPVNRIFARPFGRNKASQRVLENAGFILEAVFEQTIFKWGQVEDEYVFAIRRAAAGI